MKNNQELERVEERWRVKLPDRFNELFERVPDATHVKLRTGELFELPYSLLDPDEIVDAADVALDWEIPEKIVPIIGDFHDLVCLDYRSTISPQVVALNDERELKFLHETLDEFLEGLVSEPAEPFDPSDIVSSRLDF